MRYITHISNLMLFSKGDGTAFNPVSSVKYRFGNQGVLILGSPTTNVGTANKIYADATGTDYELMTIYDTDLNGATSDRIEMCGQGTLNAVAVSTSLTPLNKGFRGKFFEAPPITPGATTVVATAGVLYKVLTGSVTYDSVVYETGDTFESDGSATTTSTTNGGTFALTLPRELTAECEKFRTEAFRIKTLKVGDESLDYWNFTPYGADPRASNSTADADEYLWTR